MKTKIGNSEPVLNNSFKADGFAALNSSVGQPVKKSEPA
jgi:hypothetical protein